jgi:hypothetical protein
MPVTSATGPDDETVPLPAILGDAPDVHTAGKDRDAVAPVRPARRRPDGPSYHGRGTRRTLDQLKALYRTAEAIGEEALTRHFDQMSQHQCNLIRQYFEQAGLGRTSGGRGIRDPDPTSGASPRSTPLLPPH